MYLTKAVLFPGSQPASDRVGSFVGRAVRAVVDQILVHVHVLGDAETTRSGTEGQVRPRGAAAAHLLLVQPLTYYIKIPIII